MSTPTPIRIPVCSEDCIIERVDPSRARRLQFAPNVTVIRKRKGGDIVRLILASEGDDSAKKKARGDPKKYTYLDRSEEMPQGVHALKYIPTSTADLFDTVVNELAA